MKKFLILLHEDIERLQNLSPKEMEDLVKAHMEWAAQLGQEGRYLAGDGLEDHGKLIAGKEMVIKDGPYLESKEIIGGYYLIQANDLTEATEIAKGCPCHHWGGTTEIRPIMDY
ncbi:MAG: hypothetical protein KDC53_20140 [Saprospiraceae bacterium]|nr:hypothetical protein [Saprospiraceae bacterium]